jgi:hypothetical protein
MWISIHAVGRRYEKSVDRLKSASVRNDLIVSFECYPKILRINLFKRFVSATENRKMSEC